MEQDAAGSKASVRTKEDQVLSLARLALGQLDGRLSRSPLGRVIVALPNGVTCRVEDEASTDWLADLAFTDLEYVPNSQQLNRVVKLLRARAPLGSAARHLGDEALDELQRQPLAEAICQYMHTPQRAKAVTRTVGSWLKVLREVATKFRIDRKSKRWPKTSTVLSRFIKQIEALLRELGIEIQGWKDTNLGMEVTLARLDCPQSANASPDASPDASLQRVTSGSGLAQDDAVVTKRQAMLARLAQRKQSAGVVEAGAAVGMTVGTSTSNLQG